MTILVITRKLGEVVVIGEGPDAVVVTVVDIDRGRIRLGFTAPKDVPIYRRELLPPAPPSTPNEG